MRTIAQAITDLATKAKGSQAVPRGRKITDALDALADAMAGTDVPLANCTTIVNAIDVVTANYTPSGGGVDVGAPVQVMYRSNVAAEPAVGDAVNLAPIYDVAAVKIGDATIMDVTTTGSGIQSDVGWASGATLTTIWMPAYSDPAEDAAFAFTYTVETVEEVDYYKTVSILQDAVTMETMNDGDPMKRYTFTVPEVDEGTYFAVAYVGDWE
jgi:hypothetical protein